MHSRSLSVIDGSSLNPFAEFDAESAGALPAAASVAVAWASKAISSLVVPVSVACSIVFSVSTLLVVGEGISGCSSTSAIFFYSRCVGWVHACGWVLESNTDQFQERHSSHYICEVKYHSRKKKKKKK